MENKYHLEALLRKQPKPNFPKNGTTNYVNRYECVVEYLNNTVHPYVNQISMIIDGGFLTDHGPEHIKTVINKASELLQHDKFKLKPYEIYILLSAIHFHDVGHVKNGRAMHEYTSSQVMTDLGKLLGDDAVELRTIWRIADAHGGKVISSHNDKDKISNLPVEEIILGVPIRMQFLAAILRFADELADDCNRSSRYIFENNNIPETSQIYHAYALSLHSVSVNLQAREVKLSFDMKKDVALRLYGKGTQREFLLNEIFERTYKMYCECIYCMRFFPVELQINAISVQIEIYDGYDQAHDPIRYRLKEIGYPEFVKRGVREMCKDDICFDGQPIDGESLKNRLQKQ